MIIGDVLRNHPETLAVFKEYNLECYECQISDLETLQHGADVHKVDIDILIESLNKVIL